MNKLVLEKEDRGELIYDTQTSQYLSIEDKDKLDRARFDLMVADKSHKEILHNISLKRYEA